MTANEPRAACFTGVATGCGDGNTGATPGGVLGIVVANEPGPGAPYAACGCAASGAVRTEAGGCVAANPPCAGAATATPMPAGIGIVLLVPGKCEGIVADSGCVRCDATGAASARVACSRDESRALA